MDFLYFGETRIFQENLETFLALAGELELKGLAAGAEKNIPVESTNTGPISKKKKRTPQTIFHPKLTEQPVEDMDQKPTLIEEAIPILKKSVTLEIGELDEQIESMISATNKTDPTRSGKIFTCKVCEKEGSRKDIGRHIESKHITGISHNCDICGKTAR